MDLQAEPQAQPQPHGHERAHVPMTARGRLKLTDWIIGTFPSYDAAQSCADELVSAGMAEDHVLVESPDGALGQMRAEAAGERAEGWLTQLMTSLEEAVSGTGSELRERYIAEANAGRWLAGAHDGQGNQIDRIRNVMSDHGGRCMYLFEPGGARCMG